MGEWRARDIGAQRAWCACDFGVGVGEGIWGTHTTSYHADYHTAAPPHTHAWLLGSKCAHRSAAIVQLIHGCSSAEQENPIVYKDNIGIPATEPGWKLLLCNEVVRLGLVQFPGVRHVQACK